MSKSACLCAVNRSDVDAVCPICGHLGFGVAPGKTLETKAFTLQPLRYVPSFCCCWQSLASVGLWTVPGSTGEVFYKLCDDNGRLNMVHQSWSSQKGLPSFPLQNPGTSDIVSKINCHFIDVIHFHDFPSFLMVTSNHLIDSSYFNMTSTRPMAAPRSRMVSKESCMLELNWRLNMAMWLHNLVQHHLC